VEAELLVVVHQGAAFQEETLHHPEVEVVAAAVPVHSERLQQLLMHQQVEVEVAVGEELLLLLALVVVVVVAAVEEACP
jgi:hypothetical protein